MAFITQEEKKEIAERVKKVFKKYGVKGSFSIRNYSTLKVTLKSGKLDFSKLLNGRDHASVMFVSQQEKVLGKDSVEYKFLTLVDEAIRGDSWYDNSDIMTDYHDVAFYYSIEIGSYDKPYTVDR